ncbi:MAG: ANTAR domain-containing protein [Gammaproteobacteria bacterium]|nr:ANTAR domain-containing protein [Gammaproteobacteria bacterium]
MSQKVLLVDVTNESDDSFKRALLELGYEVPSSLRNLTAIESHLKLDKRIQYVVVNMTTPSDSYFDGLANVVNNHAVPVVVFTGSSTRKFDEKAASVGLSAYIVSGFVPERVRHIMDLAKARFHEMHAIKVELEKTRASLAERKIIEKAKGILMRRRTIDEESAFQMMRKMAMDKNLKLADIANNIINADTLFN